MQSRGQALGVIDRISTGHVGPELVQGLQVADQVYQLCHCHRIVVIAHGRQVSGRCYFGIITGGQPMRRVDYGGYQFSVGLYAADIAAKWY